MEKFALLNLLKAIDGLKNAQKSQNAAAEPPVPPPPAAAPNAENSDGSVPITGNMPNLMYETLMRHEQMSNRIRNKK